MAVVGSAEVVVRAITNKVKADIQKAFADARPVVQQEGRRAGTDFANEFNRALNKQLSGPLAHNMSTAASNGSKAAGDAMRRDLPGQVESAANSAGNAAERALGNAGRRGGNAFGSGFLASGFAASAVAASAAFTKLYATGNLLAPAIANLIGMISALASGLFAVVGAAGQAVGALMALPGLLGVFGQLFAAVKLGFGGVGEAMKAGVKAQDAMAASSGGAAEAAKKSAGAQVAAARAVAAAQERLKIAQEEARKAQERLNNAQDAAKEGAEEQAMAQKLLAAAQQQRNAVLADPNASAEQGANAQKALDDAERANDAVAKSREDALNRMRNAAEKNDQAQRNLAAAEAARNKAQKGAQDGASAGGIQTPAIKAAQAYQQALEKLTPAARAFVEQLLNMRERVKDLRDAIANEMFPPLTEALKLLDDDKLWNVLEENLSETGRLFGEAGLSLGKLIDTDVFRSGLDKWLKNNNEILEIFTGKNSDAYSTLDALASIIGKVALAIQPLTERFARWIDGVIKAKDAAWQVGDAISGMTGFFKRAGDRAALLGKIIGNIFRAFGNLGRAADPAGMGLLRSFKRATKEFERFTKRIEDDGSAGKFFDGVATNVRKISRLVSAITEEFVALGDNEGIGNLAEGLIPVVEKFGEIGDKLTEGGIGDSLAKFADEVATLLNTLTDSGQIKTFIDTLSWVVEKVNGLISAIGKIPGAKKVVGYILVFAAVARAISFATGIAKFFGKAIIGGPIKVLQGLFKMLNKIPGMSKLLGRLGNTKVGKGLGLMKKGSDDAKDALEKQMITDKAKIEILEKLEKQAIDTGIALELLGEKGAPGVDDAKQAAAPAADAAADAAGGASGGASTLITQAAGPDNDKAEKKTRKLSGAFGKVGGAAKKAGGAFKSLGGGLLGLAGGPIGLILMFLPQIIKGFTMLYAKSPAFRTFINAIVSGFKSVVAWAKPIVTMIGKWLIKVIDDLFKKVNKAMPTIKKVIGVAFSAIKTYITKIYIPAWKLVFNVIRALWPLVKRVFSAVKNIVFGVFRGIKVVWNKVLSPAFDGIRKSIGVLRDVFSRVFSKIRNIFDGFKTAFGKVWTFISDTVGKIKGAFGTIKDSIKSAFTGLGGSVRGGLNKFIGFLNDKLIGPLNSVTSKFGLDIPDIKTFASGGKVTGPGTATSDSIAARLSNGEFVVKTRSAKSLGYKDLEYMNRTGKLPEGATDGTGGLLGWAKDTISGGAKAVADGLKYVGKKGAGKVLETLVNTAKGAISGLGLGDTSFIKDFAMGILDKLAEAAANWGGDKGKTPPPSQYGPWANTAGLPNIQGWAYPLASRFPITQEPNQGHSPSWAVDIGSPTGVPVVAVAAGVVKTIIDKGMTSYGKYIEIAHADGTTSLYAHLNEFLVKLGKRVAAGDIIARSGHSGGVRSSTGGDGSHLHFELKPGSNTKAMMALRRVMLAKGGVAKATSGGIPAIIAEAGRDERVEPLDRDGMSRRDKAILRAVANASGGRGNVSITVNNPEPERASTSVTKALRSRAITHGWTV